MRGIHGKGLAHFQLWLILVLATTFGVASSYAEAQSTQGIAFKQAIAEAASSQTELAEYYRDRAYTPIWTDPAYGAARRQALLEALDQAPQHGLPRTRYDRDSLYAALAAVQTTRDLGMVEVTLSRAFLQIARDMQTGIVQPGEVVEAIKRDVVASSAEDLLDGLQRTAARDFIQALAPDTPESRSLRREKLRLDRAIANGGWGSGVPVKKLEPGDSGAGVVRLRDRLLRMGYLRHSVTARYDRAIESAVQHFQNEHGLEVDGIAGVSTLEEINVSATRRLQSIHVAMERERWLNTPDGRGARHILVNLTDFSARVIDDGAQSFYTRAVIGKNSQGRRSPEFSDQMEYMVINPTWHVPRSIAVKEYLPKLRRNPNAVAHLKMVNSRGQVVSRQNINFAAYGARSFPYAMKQPPSSTNALGLVKFMFPNEYNIYLHDTPQKKLFARETRAYSHGCIRLSDPFGFAYHLLARQEADPKAFFHATLETGRETYVDLEQTVPVHIIYRTAISDSQGEIGYRRDIYGRDAEIWKALVRTGVSLPGVQG